MVEISKAFPGVKALNKISLEVDAGETIALMGENGAGKSTLMKILSGECKKDDGKIFFEDREVEINNPNDAQMLGISVIHQELNLMDNLDIAENIFIGREKRRFGFFADKKKHFSLTRELLEYVGLDADPHTKIADLSIAQRQMVEIARSIAFNSKLIIMDEPTSSLTERESGRLKEIIRGVCSRGVSVIYISHRMEDVFDIAQRIIVLRDGCIAGAMDKSNFDSRGLISLMVGREITDIFPRTVNAVSGEALRVEGVHTKNLLKDISFYIHKGEILGFAGLVGAGRSELMNVIFGLDAASKGEIYVDGKKETIRCPSDAIRLGIGLVSEDRKRLGLILNMTVRENISLPSLKRLVKRLFIQPEEERELAELYIKKLGIRTYGAEQAVINLSGGNQQKVVLAKWLAANPKVLILDEPTRGVDIGAKKEIHSLINSLAGMGMAIIMISSELPEVLGMSDRIVIMREGRIRAELPRDKATQEAVMSLAVN